MATLLRKLVQLEKRRAAVLRRRAAHLNVELLGIVEAKYDDCVQAAHDN